MSELPFYLGAFVLVLGVLIVVHEYGHFAAARLCGVKVLRFSVGFGPVVWSRRLGADRTEWSISLLPLGGYVRMLDEREGEVPAHERGRAFNRQSVGRRSAIVAAGPGANFLLAILIYWALFWQGSVELRPVLGEPVAGSPAARAGIARGDRVLGVDGDAVQTWQDFQWLVLHKAARQSEVELELAHAGGGRSIRRLPLESLAEQGWEGDIMAHLGLGFYRSRIPAVAGQVQPDSPAARAGVRAGDRFLAIDGKPVEVWADVVETIRLAPGRAMEFDLERDGRRLRLEIVPASVEDRGIRVGRIGVSVAEAGLEGEPELKGFVRYGFLEAGMRAVRETWDKSVFSLVMFGKMLTGEASWRNLSGPVTIADYAGQSARLGLDYYLKFMALVSISLGVLNLLPIPVLDGGHLMYHILEVIKGAPLSERVMAWGQQVGLALLFTLMAFAFFNDLSRLLGPLFNG
ncbi:RIP metalloprotease RseP [Azovibrio restrictus]|uniref:RIP metalloprotease RseP n=1 Tax=Azovibrio restrictus TaxID=146938 RepID=UPI0026EC727C|nr:RIP metalloprotease RseP [Azovibrio restrictus]